MTCDKIKSIIIKSDFEDLNNKEKNALDEHLKNCETCRSYKEIILKSKKSIKESESQEFQLPYSFSKVVMERSKPKFPRIIVTLILITIILAGSVGLNKLIDSQDTNARTEVGTSEIRK